MRPHLRKRGRGKQVFSCPVTKRKVEFSQSENLSLCFCNIEPVETVCDGGRRVFFFFLIESLK